MTMDKNLLLHYKTMRKCFHCKEFISLEDEYDGVIYYLKNLYHIDCLKRKLVNGKKMGKTEEEFSEIILEFLDSSRIHMDNIIYKNHLYKYLMDKYNTVMLSHNIYTKFEEIFTGNFKNMNKPIPPEHILDMWLRQQKFLDGIWTKNKLSGSEKINYDMSVLVNKYNSYLEWIEKGKTKLSEVRLFNQTEKINIENIETKKGFQENILDDEGDED